MSNFKNLEDGKYKTCGYGDPIYDRDGDRDNYEVACKHDLSTGYCGDIDCPIQDDRYEYERQEIEAMLREEDD